jgi:hypothetical protein
VAVGGTTDEPLIFTIKGYQYVYSRQMELSFAGITQTGTYYIKAQRASGDELGLKMVESTATSAATVGSNVLTDTTKNFANLGSNAQVLPGHVVEFPNIQRQGQNYCTVVTAVTATTLTLSGALPRALLVGEPYRVWSPRELALSLTLTRLEGQ